MKTLYAIMVCPAFFAALEGVPAARQYRGPVRMRGPIQGRRVRMRAPVHARRTNPYSPYNDRFNFNLYKWSWGTATDQYDWNYRFKNVNSTETYRQKGFPSQSLTDYKRE